MQMKRFNVFGVLARAIPFLVYLPAGSVFTSRLASERKKKKNEEKENIIWTTMLKNYGDAKESPMVVCMAL